MLKNGGYVASKKHTDVVWPFNINDIRFLIRRLNYAGLSELAEALQAAGIKRPTSVNGMIVCLDMFAHTKIEDTK